MQVKYETSAKQIVNKALMEAVNECQTPAGQMATVTGKLEAKLQEVQMEKRSLELKLNNPDYLIRHLEKIARFTFNAYDIAELLLALVDKNEDRAPSMVDLRHAMSDVIRHMESALVEIEERETEIED